MLRVADVSVTYNGAARALRGLTLDVNAGEIAVLLGGNGAGKTTTLRAVSNLLAMERGAITTGTIHLNDERIDGLNPSHMIDRGVVQVMEGRHCFPHLTIHENLLAGSLRNSNPETEMLLNRVYRYFPRLRERSGSAAALTSGGEQQMCAIARALMTDPSFVLLDEPSMGLAPKVVAEVFEIVRRLNTEEGVTFLIAEQSAAVALESAHVAFVIEDGRVVLQGRAEALINDSRVQQAYLGGAAAGTARPNFREMATHRGVRPLHLDVTTQIDRSARGSVRIPRKDTPA